MTAPVSYLQWDSRWKNIMYSVTGDKKQTIGSSGCGPTAAAMVVATLKDKRQTPVEACKYARTNGYRTANSGTSYGFFPKYLGTYGIKCEQITGSRLDQMAASKSAPIKQKLLEHLKSGGWAICCMGPGTWTSSGHFVLAYGINSDDKVLIRDPNSTADSRVKGNKQAFLSQIKHIFLVYNQKEDDMTPEEVRKIIREEQKYIKDIKDAPEDFRPILKELQDKKILNGTGTEEVGMSYEAVRLMVVQYRMIKNLV